MSSSNEPLSAAAPGLSLAEPYALGLFFLGVAVLAAIGALTHQGNRAFSASLIYLVLGILAAIGIQVLGLDWIDPIRDAGLLERVSELVVVVALFGTGLKLDRKLAFREWRVVIALLVVAMPLTIAAVALLASELLGLSIGAALILGAVLAPTDPVLAGDVGVGPPDEDETERDANFALTGEAGLNDGLAYPFLLLGVLFASGEFEGLTTWVLEDVAYKILIGVLLGAVMGYGIAGLGVRLRDRRFLSDHFDGWAAIAAVLLIYGACEALSGYGFIAAFVGGLAFRRYERSHDYNQGVHDGAQTVEHFGELALVLTLGSMLSLEGLLQIGPLAWVLALGLLFVIRPIAVFAASLRSGIPFREKAFIAWFGVRGIGSIYYAAAVIGLGALTPAENLTVFWTMALCVVLSIVLHGITATPLERLLLNRPARASSE